MRSIGLLIGIQCIQGCLCVVSAAEIPSDGESLRKLFLSSYPDAIRELERTYTKLEMSLISSAQNVDGGGTFVPSGGRVNITFSRNGELIVYSGRPADAVEPGETNEAVALRDPAGRIFLVDRFEGSAEYVVTSTEMGPREFKTFLRRLVRPAFAPFCVGTNSISELMDSSDCTFERFRRRNTNGKPFVCVDYEIPRVHANGYRNVETGTFVLAPHLNWALTEAEWFYLDINDRHVTMGCSCSVRYAKNGPPTVEEVVLNITNADGQLTRTELFDVTRFENKDISESAFTLSAYGLSVPDDGSRRRRRTQGGEN